MMKLLKFVGKYSIKILVTLTIVLPLLLHSNGYSFEDKTLSRSSFPDWLYKYTDDYNGHFTKWEKDGKYYFAVRQRLGVKDGTYDIYDENQNIVCKHSAKALESACKSFLVGSKIILDGYDREIPTPCKEDKNCTLILSSCGCTAIPVEYLSKFLKSEIICRVNNCPAPKVGAICRGICVRNDGKPNN